MLQYFFTKLPLSTSTQSYSATSPDRKAVLVQGNCTMPEKLFLVKSSQTTFTTSFRVAKLRRPGFRAPNVPPQTKI